jgi:hypothetical protein
MFVRAGIFAHVQRFGQDGALLPAAGDDCSSGGTLSPQKLLQNRQVAIKMMGFSLPYLLKFRFILFDDNK